MMGQSTARLRDKLSLINSRVYKLINKWYNKLIKDFRFDNIGKDKNAMYIV